MTNEKKLEYARTMVSLRIGVGADLANSEWTETLAWLISQAEAAQRCEALAAAWERDAETVAVSFAIEVGARLLRAALNGGRGSAAGAGRPAAIHECDSRTANAVPEIATG